MTLKERIVEDIKIYMKEKDPVSLNAVRMLKSEIKNAEIEAKKELDDNGVIKVVQSAIKKRRDSAEIYKKAGREELAEKELAEIKILEKYLPAQLSEDEIRKIVKSVAAGLDPAQSANFGILMKAVMSKVNGAADGRTVKKIIEETKDGDR